MERPEGFKIRPMKIFEREDERASRRPTFEKIDDLFRDPESSAGSLLVPTVIG